jgi:hypothetical protein
MLPACPLAIADLGAGPSTSTLADADAVAKKIEEVEMDVKDIKEKLKVPQSDADRQALQGQLPGLQMQLGALCQERLLQLQAGAMPHQ